MRAERSTIVNARAGRDPDRQRLGEELIDFRLVKLFRLHHRIVVAKLAMRSLHIGLHPLQATWEQAGSTGSRDRSGRPANAQRELPATLIGHQADERGEEMSE